MQMRPRHLRMLPVALLLAARPAGAQLVPGQAGETDPGPAHFVLAQGWFDAVQRSPVALDLRLEYRDNRRFWIVRPWGGIELTGHGSMYFVTGVLTDVRLPGRLLLTPSLGAGAFVQGGGKDLGFPLEFRSQLELAWQLDGGGRVGAAFSHTSNATLGDSNPGAEALVIFFALPSRGLFGSQGLLETLF